MKTPRSRHTAGDRQKRMGTRRKSLGQNFLADPRTARRIVRLFDPRPGQEVLEVGPGRGALTDLLVGRVGRLVAVEKDRALASALEERLGAERGVRIVAADILAVPMEALPFHPEGPVRVLSNLPYSVATAVLQRLLLWGRASDLMVMVQREVADRIQAEAGTGERGYLSVMVNLLCTVRRCFELQPGAFRPPPQVVSALLEMRVRARPAAGVEDTAGFLRLVGAGFAHRRKTLYNNLRSAFRLVPEAWDRARARAGLGSKVRAEELDLESWAALHRSLLLDGPLSAGGPTTDPSHEKT